MTELSYDACVIHDLNVDPLTLNAGAARARTTRAHSHQTMTVERATSLSQSEHSTSRYLPASVVKSTILKIPAFLKSQQGAPLDRISERGAVLVAMSTLSTNVSSQVTSTVYRRAVAGPPKKFKAYKDVSLPEVPKVIDNGNGRRYFRGRLLGKVSSFRVVERIIKLPFLFLFEGEFPSVLYI